MIYLKRLLADPSMGSAYLSVVENAKLDKELSVTLDDRRGASKLLRLAFAS
jgi:hypothetical protein